MVDAPLTQTVVANTDTGLAQALPPEEAQAALQAGTHNIILTDPQGQSVNVPADKASDYLQQGYTQPTEEQYRDLLHTADVNSPKEQFKTGVQEALGSMSFGASKLEQRLLGATPEEISARKEANPVSAITGEIAGLLMPTGAGPLKAAEEAGYGAVKALGLKDKIAAIQDGKKVLEEVYKVDNALGRIGTAATKFAVENMAFEGFRQAGDFMAGDPHQTAETALADIGMAGLFGGALGAVGKGTGELFNATIGPKINRILETISNKANGLPDELKAASGLEFSPELNAALGDNPLAQDLARSQMRSDTAKGALFREAVETQQKAVRDEALATMGKTADDIAKLPDISKYETGEQIAASLRESIDKRYGPIAKKYEKFEEMFKEQPVSPDARLNAANRINQAIVDQGLLNSKLNADQLKFAQDALSDLSGYANANQLKTAVEGIGDKIKDPRSPLFRIGSEIKSILQDLQEATVDSAASGTNMYAEFKALQKEYSGFKSLSKELGEQLSIGKTNTYGKFMDALKARNGEEIASKLSLKENVNLQRLLEQEFPQVNEIAKAQELNKVLKASLDKEGEFSIEKFAKQLTKMQPELRDTLFTADQLHKLDALHQIQSRIPKGSPTSLGAKIDKAMQNAGSGALGIAGLLVGGGHIAAGLTSYIGGHIAGHVPDAVRMSLLKFLGSNAAVDARGFAGMVKMATAFVRGEAKVQKAVKGVFSGKADAIELVSTDKLRKLVDDVQANPGKLMDVSVDSAHYLPDQSAVVSLAAARNLQYLASLKPNTQPLTPLSPKLVASKEQEAKYENALQIAQNPLIIMDKVKNGSVTLMDMQHVKTMWPSLANKMQSKLNEQLMDAVHSEQQIPYKTKIGLSVFMGQPLDASLRPQNIQAAQPMQATMGNQAAKTGSQPIRKNDQLIKISNQEATGMQAREANKHK